MKDLSLTQEYMICTVNEKGDLLGYNQNAVACLIVSGLLEMQMTISHPVRMAHIKAMAIYTGKPMDRGILLYREFV